MKKLYSFAAALAVVACAASFAGYKAYDNNVIGNESELTSQNVEALTNFEEAFQKAYSEMHETLRGVVSSQCPGGEQNCVDITTELSIPGWFSMSATFYFYQEVA